MFTSNFIQNTEANVPEKAASISRRNDEDEELNQPPKKKARTVAKSAKTKIPAVSNFTTATLQL